MKKQLLFLLLFIVTHVSAQVQISSSFGFITEGSFGKNARYTGGALELAGRVQINERLRIGGTLGLNKMRIALDAMAVNDVTKRTYGAVYKQIIPVSFGGEYYLSTRRMIKPYVGFDLGGYFTNYEVSVEPNYVFVAPGAPLKNSFNPGISPSVGLQLQDPIDRIGLYIRVKHTGIFYEGSGMTNLWAISGGVVIKIGKKIGWKPPVIEIKGGNVPYYEKKTVF